MKQLRGIKPIFDQTLLWFHQPLVLRTWQSRELLLWTRKEGEDSFLSGPISLQSEHIYVYIEIESFDWNCYAIIFLRNTENDANGITSTVTNSSHKPCSSMFISSGKTRQFIGCSVLRVKKFSDYCVNDRGSVIICQASEKLPQLLSHWIIHLFLSTI